MDCSTFSEENQIIGNQSIPPPLNNTFEDVRMRHEKKEEEKE